MNNLHEILKDCTIKRIDNEIVIYYPYYERIEDEFGKYMKRKTKKYSLEESRNNPEKIIQDYEEYILQRRKTRGFVNSPGL